MSAGLSGDRRSWLHDFVDDASIEFEIRGDPAAPAPISIEVAFAELEGIYADLAGRVAQGNPPTESEIDQAIAAVEGT